MFGMGLGQFGFARSAIGAAIAAFNPASLFAAGQQGAWYDPSDFASMFQDSAGTVPVTATTQPVGRINDKSGRANHATQATAAARPILQQDAGGRYYLAFDGVDDNLATAAIPFTTDKMSIFTGVLKAVSTVLVIAELSANTNTNTGSFYLVSGANFESLGRGDATVVGGQATSIASATPDTAVITATHDIAGDLSTIRRNAVAGTNGIADKGLGNFGNHPLYIGSRAGAGFFFNGRMYSMIVRGAASSAQEITDAETYVNSKTGAF